ncbi:hypothetical protein [Frigoriflavimonas asaccharolytica]|uniref:Uncharacterized protein n=1 Tax=Frigoriflavimonas asaccharolytica TaxID=2735899 RepID=A0A8J8K7Q6_9FLAO|nr:hypothetical protein [Frigoriflavimonas asaccharolytica]NRS91202.1 hypothetical protein [Frigoriflavimonas asaccharolytica]
MKNIYKISYILFLFSFVFFSAQPGKDWKKMSTEEKKAELNKMTSEEKIKLMQGFKQNLVEEQLEIKDTNREAFSALYNNYQSSQRDIKNTFRPSKDFENMTDEEAILELDKSFEVGQKLLNNKKEYAKKFQKIIKPQQVLELFESEGRMRAKVRERNQEVEGQTQSTENTESAHRNESERRR